MNQVIEILMRRDGLSKEEATERFNEVHEMVSNALGNAQETVEDILAEELGLEMDYIFDFI